MGLCSVANREALLSVLVNLGSVVGSWELSDFL